MASTNAKSIAGATVATSLRGIWRESGYEVFAPGAQPGQRFAFPAEEWKPESFYARLTMYPSDIVYLPMLAAATPRAGALTRLVWSIFEAGMTPVVIDPLDAMPDILLKWRWSHIAKRGVLMGREVEAWWPYSNCGPAKRKATP